MPIPKSIIEDLVKKNIDVKKSHLVSGGNINEAVKIISSDAQEYFLKFNRSQEGQQIINSEIQGLDLLDSIGSPIPTQVSSSSELSYILMEWIEPGEGDASEIAHILAKLHRNTNPKYGLSSENHIGSLPQKNTWNTDFIDFYISCRIEPQLRMAAEWGSPLPIDLDRFSMALVNEIPTKSPNLVHGDLWGGNMIHSNKGSYFIDPSVSYGHREMDLGMMRLFGGFSESVFTIYHDIYPLEGDWKGRSDLFQLYYLLVHLNLFGNQYRTSVQKIFDKYA